MPDKKLKIWSIRWSVAYGNHWQYERDCDEANVHDWLEVFRKDEPNVLFVASAKKPKRIDK